MIIKFSDLKFQICVYSNKNQTIDYANHNSTIANIIDLSLTSEKSGLNVMYETLLKKKSTNNVERMCDEIDDYDSVLTSDIFLIFQGFDNYTSDQISDFVQVCYEWSGRFEHIKMALFIPKEKCILKFQDASKIKIRYL